MLGEIKGLHHVNASPTTALPTSAVRPGSIESVAKPNGPDQFFTEKSAYAAEMSISIFDRYPVMATGALGFNS